MVVNMYLPLFLGAKGNFFAIYLSFENAILLIMSIRLFLKRKQLAMIKKESPVVSYLWYYFVFGIMLLGLINANLGLASREKMMYIPQFALVYFIVDNYCKNKKINIKTGFK
jgi:hypothetical protein